MTIEWSQLTYFITFFATILSAFILVVVGLFLVCRSPRKDSEVEVEVSGKGGKIRLGSVCPGIIVILFGAALFSICVILRPRIRLYDPEKHRVVETGKISQKLEQGTSSSLQGTTKELHLVAP